MQSLTAVLVIALSCAGFSSASPVEKVVKLLTDMKKSLVADEASEKGSYDKYACWCTTTTRDKGAAIDQAKLDLKQLKSEIMKHSAAVASAASDIQTHAEDMKTNHEDQQVLTNTRQLENKAFNALKAEMTQALQSVNKALRMLKIAPQFLQSSTQSLSSEEASAVQSALSAIPEQTLGALTAKKLAQLQDLGSAVEKHKYNPSSGSLTGILQSLSDQMTGDLATETSSEDSAKVAYANLMKTKVKGITGLQNELDKTAAKKADAARELAAAKENYDDTQEQLNANIQLFQDTVNSCQAKAGALEERQKSRALELEGVGKALEILTSDDARKLFSTAIDASSRFSSKAASFLQVPDAQTQAYLKMKALATKSQSVALAKIAAHVRLASRGQFDEIKKSIDSVISVVKEEQAADNTKKKECKEEYTKIAKATAQLTWEVEKNDAKMEDLQSEIDKLNEEKAAAIASIADTNKQIKLMGEQRTKEKDAFDYAKKEDQDAIGLLGRAKQALVAIYAKKAEAEEPPLTFLQAGQPEQQLSNADSRKNQGGSIVALMENLVEGLQDEIRVQTKVEAAAIDDHRKAGESAAEVVKSLIKKKGDLAEVIATRTEDRNAESTKRGENLGDLKLQMDRRTAIQPDCDFMLNNWQSRFERRTAEEDGLVQAKSFLASILAPAKVAEEEVKGKEMEKVR